jgi:hypothetical protein
VLGLLDRTVRSLLAHPLTAPVRLNAPLNTRDSAEYSSTTGAV